MSKASEVKEKTFRRDGGENSCKIEIPPELLSFCNIDFFLFRCANKNLNYWCVFHFFIF